MSRKDSQPVGGEDSLLDVIANLVGVLIILVAIASVSSRQRLMNAAQTEAQNQRLEQARSERQTLRTRADRVEAGFQAAERELKKLQAVEKQLQMLRHQSLIERELELRELQRSSAGDDDLEATRHRLAEAKLTLTRLQSELTGLHQAIAAEKNLVPEQRVIRHYPTPIAKTVFFDEVHFRLADGKVSFVPIDQLVELMKAKCQEQPLNLQAGEDLLDQVGPLDGFRMHYRIAARAESAGGGDAQRMLVELQQFSLTPTDDLQAENVETVLSGESRFAARLSRLRPEKTTVSIWVYPDEFGHYSQLRDWLRERGYQTAAWPLEKGQAISGGPNGVRTTAQ